MWSKAGIFAAVIWLCCQQCCNRLVGLPSVAETIFHVIFFFLMFHVVFTKDYNCVHTTETAFLTIIFINKESSKSILKSRERVCLPNPHWELVPQVRSLVAFRNAGATGKPDRIWSDMMSLCTRQEVEYEKNLSPSERRYESCSWRGCFCCLLFQTVSPSVKLHIIQDPFNTN